MATLFMHAYKKSRGQIFGWGLALLGLGMLIVPAYDMVAANQAQFETLMQNYPEEVGAFFGDLSQMATPSGFLHLEFFSYMPLVLGIFALLQGSGLIASDEESGRLELFAAQPISRATFFFSRLLAMAGTTATILGLGWLGFLIGMRWSALDLGAIELLPPFISLFSLAFLFAALALFLSQVLPSRRTAAMVTGLVLMMGYFVSALARLNEHLQPVARFSPLNYYQGGEALNDFNLAWTAGLLGLSLLLAGLAFMLYQRRDLRIGGEGSLRIPLLGTRSP